MPSLAEHLYDTLGTTIRTKFFNNIFECRTKSTFTSVAQKDKALCNKKLHKALFILQAVYLFN